MKSQRDIGQFEIGSRYVTAKVQNRYGENVTINIHGGRPGIELQESFFKMKEKKGSSSIVRIFDNKVGTR